MPRTRSLAWSELKIGVLTIVAIVITGLTIFMLTGGRGFFWQQYYLKTRFQNVAGLKPGSPVRLAGVEVGSVDSVALAGSQVDVTMSVNQAYRPQITTASVASLGSVSLLGESAVDITPTVTGTPIAEWGYVPSGKATASLSDVTTQAAEGVGDLTALLKDMRQGKGTVGQLMTNQRLYTELQRFAASAADLTTAIKDGRGTLGQLVTNPATARALQATVQNLDQITARLNAGDGSLGKLLKDESFARSLSATTANMEAITAKMKAGEGTAGKLMTDSSLYNRLDSLTNRLDALVSNLNQGEGTAGQLLKDRQLYENMNGAVSDVRALIADIRKDPKKFLNVKVSIF
jgi:phospholipid/cholesterol/gamma-HCH transport system substrate-binding protein